MSSPKHSIVFSKVIPALQADRHGVITFSTASTILQRDREWRPLAGNARECAGATNSAAPDPAITRRRSGVATARARRRGR